MEHSLFLNFIRLKKFKTCKTCSMFCLIVSNGDLNVYTRLDHNGCDLLDNFGGRPKVDDPLVKL